MSDASPFAQQAASHGFRGKLTDLGLRSQSPAIGALGKLGYQNVRGF
ncbi:hypothetical protein SAMN05518861_1663 [Mesorhizobium sp. YR577]|nr:hypothetical protein SAMN05518861_1663 [Mesorhizobium sp. YR577]